MLGEYEMRDIDERREQIMSHQPKRPSCSSDQVQIICRKFLRCGVVAFADEASSLSLQNNKISVREPRKPRRFLAGDRHAKESPAPP